MRAFAVSFLMAALAATPYVTSEVRAVEAQPRDVFSAPVKFTAFAVSLGGPRSASGTATVDISINRWSSEAERERLVAALEKGQETLLETLQGLRPVGRIQTPGSVGYDLHYANAVKGEDGGHRIFIATDRPVGFWEAANRPRSFDYPFTFIELRVNSAGEGEGKLALATKVISSGDRRVIQLENYAAEPVHLNQVKRVGGSN